MLAYVFTHWPADPDHRPAYEQQLLAFHEALADNPSEGFSHSAVYRVQGPTWVEAEDRYEDWYLVEGSFALDPLNEAAVSARLRPAHDPVAHAAGGGLGSLYRLHSGVPRTASGGVSWLYKPAGESYADFYARFGPDAVLWRRQMVLGGPTEFLLEAPVPPPGLSAIRVSRELIYS